MRIAIDARWIFDRVSGIGLYTRELVAALARTDADNEYRLIFRDEAPRRETEARAGLADAGNFRTELCPYGIFSLTNQWRLPAWLRAQGIDVFHSTNYMMPLRGFPRGRPGRVRCVVTIHDLIPIMFPEFTPRARKTRLLPVYKRLMREIVARADRILTVSQRSRADILEHLPGVGPDRVSVVYNGVSPQHRPADRPAANNGPRTVLFVGRADPYKNLVTLVEAMALLKTESDEPLRLKVVGSCDDRYPEAQVRARELGLDDRVTWVDGLDEAGLVAAYQEADALAMPSRYEGFGLPAVEAMACGTPVVCSDGGSLPEIVGDAACVVADGDAAAYARAIRRVLDDDDYAASLVRNGLERAAEFNWDQAARETRAVYEGMVNQ